MPKLINNHRSLLFDLLEIDNAAAILDSDRKAYENGTPEEQMMLEIPVRLWAVRQTFNQSVNGKAFVLPDAAYDEEKGLDMAMAKEHRIDLNII